jgi:ribose-phosphate pyrophosphokinase
LGIISLKSAAALGGMINAHLIKMRSSENYFLKDPYLPESFQIAIEEARFTNGEAKVRLNETVRGKDIFIIADVGNYSCTYDMYGMVHHYGPDEHYQDIKRTIAAIGGKSNRITVVTPLLYESRQHRRRGRESLDCAVALQELTAMGVKDIISFDVHDPAVQNAIPYASFENIYPTYDIVKAIIERERDMIFDKKHTIVISPDTGAADRAIYYATVLGLDVGTFYKRRNYDVVESGRNKIEAHGYMGADVSDKDILIVDDIIATGDSVIDLTADLKRRGAKKIFIAATFSLFTKGLQIFDEASAKGLIDKVYSTNLSYLSPAAIDAPWHETVDMSEYTAKLIDHLNYNLSIEPLLDATLGIKTLLEQKARGELNEI